jgi:hypothetical protein
MRPITFFVCAWLLLNAALGCAQSAGSEARALGAWEASIPEWDQHIFGSDHVTGLLLHIEGQALPSQNGPVLSITEVDFRIRFQSGSTSITRCWPPRDVLTLSSITCERAWGDHVEIALENHDSGTWSGLFSWRNTPLPVTFRPLRPVSSVNPAHPLAGEWRSSDPKCSATETFHIRISEQGDEVVTYDRTEAGGGMFGEPWDIGGRPKEIELIEGADGAFANPRIFVAQLSPDHAGMTGKWLGRVAGCNVFSRVPPSAAQ